MASMLPLLLAVVSFNLDFVAGSSPASDDYDACVALDAAQCAVHAPNCTWSSEEKCHKALESHRDRIEKLGNKSMANQENRSRNHHGCADRNETSCAQTEGKCLWSDERNICHMRRQHDGKPGESVAGPSKRGEGSDKGRSGKGQARGEVSDNGRTGKGQANAMPRQDAGKPGESMAGPSKRGEGSSTGRAGKSQSNAMPRQDAVKQGESMAGPSESGEGSGKGRSGKRHGKAMPRIGIFVIVGSVVAVLICICATCLICRRKRKQGLPAARHTPGTSIANGIVVDKFGAPAFVEGVVVDGALSKV